MNETPRDASSPQRRGVVPLRFALVIGAVVVVLAAVGLSTLLSSDDNSGAATSEETSAPPKPGKYGGTDQLCHTVDRQQYEELVDMKSEVESQTADGPPEEDSGAMECDFGSGDRDGPIRIHKLLMRADLHQDETGAEVQYEEFTRDSPIAPEKMKSHNGVWKQAVSYQNKDDDMHLLVVQDDNIALTFRQTVNPFEAIESDDAVGLMTDYAEQILAALQK